MGALEETLEETSWASLQPHAKLIKAGRDGTRRSGEKEKKIFVSLTLLTLQPNLLEQKAPEYVSNHSKLSCIRWLKRKVSFKHWKIFTNIITIYCRVTTMSLRVQFLALPQF